jgi:hypothetical protein
MKFAGFAECRFGLDVHAVCVDQGGAWLGREIDCGPAPLLDFCLW